MGPEAAIDLINRYISREHLDDIDANCPLMALPTDIAHAGPAARDAYRQVLETMVGFFEANLQRQSHMMSRQRALALSAICVGAMVLARTIDDEALKDEICEAARAFANSAIAEER
ncbi:hypothetical protein [Hoeflea prorocentri]|uniref:Uncharacterized protein n=1 Tax=Hoeflea prorocentri TaxID=1922333 RepID=A0A9X3ZJD8_9HYPH|nr:hypothetical protein [Hoeflea prorocentri]MCY6383369.1 hypothetical protein [Hoeflea prorocentri]MDA5401169.1 hypothetical protein [Hoeflea prorocentri]